MRLRPKVYLGGPLTGLRYEDALAWRQYATRRLRDAGIECINPLRGKHFLQGTVIQNQYVDHPLVTDKGITTRDRFDVGRADAVLVNLLGAKQVSVGTMIEVGWADAWRKPIVLVMEPENVHNAVLLREVAGYIVPTLDEALDILIAMLGDDAD